jgi:hypothetical protein
MNESMAKRITATATSGYTGLMIPATASISAIAGRM